jgi:hypothetical protein
LRAVVVLSPAHATPPWRRNIHKAPRCSKMRTKTPVIALFNPTFD